MTTRLNTPLKREIEVDGDTYTLTISPGGLKLVPKGRRKGHELAWRDFVSGDAALAAGLNASLRNIATPRKSVDGDRTSATRAGAGRGKRSRV